MYSEDCLNVDDVYSRFPFKSIYSQNQEVCVTTFPYICFVKGSFKF